MASRRGAAPGRESRRGGSGRNPPRAYSRICVAPLRRPNRIGGTRMSGLRTLGGESADRQLVVGFMVAESAQPLDVVGFLFLQMTHHFVDEFASRFAEILPVLGVDPVLQDLGCDSAKPRRHRFDSTMLSRQHADKFAIAATAD